MRISKTALMVIAAVAPLSGCFGPEDPILGGTWLGPGNAVAHNSALQIIDPWPQGVQDTDIVVPADRGDEAGTDGSGTSSETAL